MKFCRAVLLVPLALGLLVAALASDAQQPAKVPRVGFLCWDTCGVYRPRFRGHRVDGIHAATSTATVKAARTAADV